MLQFIRFQCFRERKQEKNLNGQHEQNFNGAEALEYFLADT